MRHLSRSLFPAGLLIAVHSLAHGQSPSPRPDSLRLGPLHREAMEADPRQRQFELLARQSDLRLRNVGTEWLPSLTGKGLALYQSDVFAAPAGTGLPSPSRDIYDGAISLEQNLWEPTIGPRRRLERAKLEESEASVRTALNALREEVNRSYFSGALLVERARLLAATIADLESQLREAKLRVREGAALPSDTAVIQATLLERRQDQLQVDADRSTALIRLSELIGRPISDSASFSLPDLTEATEAARRTLAGLRARPEYAEFDRTRERLSREEAVSSAALWPRVSAFGRVGYGRPGLNPIASRFDSYFVAGLELRWAPWNWGTTSRERNTLAIARDIVASDEAAFTSALTRSVLGDLADIDRLARAIVLDDQIVLLRQRVEDETRLRFREGAVTASEFLDRETEALEARLARAAHLVEQVQARARLLTTLGLEIP